MIKAFFETIHLDNEMFKGIEKAMADKNSPERKNLDILKTFKCSIVPDIENYLQNKAVEFEKK